MLSVLIPFKNYNINTLCKCLLDQIRKDNLPIEIVICDDGSDMFLKENKTLQNLPHIKYTENTINLGRTQTRLNLAKTAAYDWLLFLDADILPVNNDFLKKHIASITKEDEIIYGGITYEKKRPKKENLLRWIYGKNRESKTAQYRLLKKPNFIISQNLLIKKNVFLDVNIHTENMYGLDNIISYYIKKKSKKIKHIENNVYHLGLETSKSFLEKAKKSIYTIHQFEETKVIGNTEFKVQQAYDKLKKLNAVGLTNFLYKIVKPFIFLNLRSSFPILLFLDFYKLNIYIELKKHG